MTTPEIIVLAIIAAAALVGLGMIIAKKSAANPDSLEAEGFKKVSQAVQLLSKMRSSVDTEISEATAKKAHLESTVAAFKDQVSKL